MDVGRQSHDPELLRGNTDSMLLFLIDQQGPAYGYGIIKEIESRSRGYFRFREGTVYPALRRLENDGLVRGELKRLPGGQERRYYTITAKGRKLLGQKLATWNTFASAMGMVLNPDRG